MVCPVDWGASATGGKVFRWGGNMFPCQQVRPTGKSEECGRTWCDERKKKTTLHEGKVTTVWGKTLAHNISKDSRARERACTHVRALNDTRTHMHSHVHIHDSPFKNIKPLSSSIATIGRKCVTKCWKSSVRKRNPRVTFSPSTLKYAHTHTQRVYPLSNPPTAVHSWRTQDNV